MAIFRSVSGRLIVLVSLAISPALLLFAVSLINMARVEGEVAALETRRLATLLALHQRQALETGEELLRALALNPAAASADGAECRAALVAALPDTTGRLIAFRTDPEGRIDCVSQGDLATIPNAWANLPPNRNDLQIDQAAVSVSLTSAWLGDQHATVLLQSPLALTTHPGTTLHLAIGLDWLGRAFEAIDLPSGWVITLLRADGETLGQFPTGPTLAVPHSPGGGMRLPPDGQSVIGADGTERIFGFRRLVPEDPSSAVLAVGIPAESALQITRTLRREGLIAIAVGLIGVALTSWVAAQALVLRATDRMLSVARLVLAGDRGARVGDPYEVGELGELARGIDRVLDDAAHRERDILDREEWFRSVLRHSSDLVLITDATGRISYISPAVERVLSYSAEALIGLTIPELVHPEDIRRVSSILRYLASQPNRVAATEHRFRHRDGSYISIESIATNLLNEPAVAGIVINSRDVTRRRRIEEMLRLVTSAVDQGSDGVVITKAWLDPPGPQVVYVNPAMLQLTGFDEGDLIDRPPDGFATPDAARVILAQMAECLASGKDVRFEVVNQDKAGREYPLLIHITPLKGESGQVGHFVCLCRDITDERTAAAEHQRLEATLRQALKMEAVGTLAGGIAHDFNNVLLPMMMLTQLTISRLPPASRERQDLTRVLVAQSRAKSLVRQILAFSRDSAGEYQSIDLRSVCTETLTLLRATLPSTVALVEVLSATPEIHADATQIQQVLMNLCSNAAQAMPSGKGTIHITLDAVDLAGDDLPDGTQPGPFCRLTVSDDGSGIQPDIMERIFDPFFTTKEVGVGTGLGLSFVHGIVAAHRGAITVQSTPGGGATFKLFLPVVPNVALAETG